MSAPLVSGVAWPLQMAGAVTGPPLARERAGIVVLAPATDGPPLVRLSPSVGGGPPRTPSTSGLPGASPTSTVTAGPRTAAAPAPTRVHPTVPGVTVVPPASPSGAPEQLWTVHRADSLWSIARSVIAARTGVAAPKASDVAPFWAALVAANRDRLRDPRDPSLVFAGQRFVIPPR
jgi:nucleoid-associated protein YgaU